MIDTQLPLGVRALDTLDAVRPRPAHGHLRRFRRRQVDAALDDHPRHRSAGHRARARSVSVAERCASSSRTTSAPKAWRARSSSSSTSDAARARAPARRVHRDPHRRVVPRPGPRRAAADGQPHPLRDGAARGRPVGRRAARDARLPAVGVRRCCPRLLERAGAADRGSITGLYTVLVEGDDMHGPDRRRVRVRSSTVTSCSSRSLATAGPLPEHRRARVDLPGRARDHHAPNSARPRPRCGGCSPRTATPRTSSRSARTSRARTRSSTARSHSEKQWTASSDKTCTTSTPASDAWAWLERLVGGA